MAACTFAVATPDTGATPNTSGAFTPAAGDLLVVLATGSAAVNETAATCTSSVGGQTFTRVGQGFFTTTFIMAAFVCDQAATAVSQTVTFDTPNDASTGTNIFVYRVSGVTKFGAAGARQFKTNFGAAAVTPTASFDAACLTANPTLGMLSNLVSPAAVTPPTDWTENASGDIGYSNPTHGAEAVHRDSGFTGTAVTWGATTSTAWGTLIVEIDASATVAPGVGAIVTAGLDPSLQFDIARGPDVGAATLAGLAPALQLDIGRGPGVGAAVIAGLEPTIVVTSPGVTIAPDVGAAVVAGLAPALSIGQTITPDVGAIAVAGLAATCHIVTTTDVGALTLTGQAPLLAFGLGPDVGSLTISGLAPTAGISYSFAMDVGALALAGVAPQINVGRTMEPDAGAAVIGGLAPSLNRTFTITIGAGAIAAQGLTPTTSALIVGGGGYGGLLVALGLNLEPPNVTPALQAGSLDLIGWSPAYFYDQSYTVPVGAVATLGYAPVVTESSGNQAPVMDVPVALAIAGLAPTVISGKPIRFPFPADTQGFVATAGAGTTMLWAAAEGNPAGSLRTITTGFNRNANNTWTLTTDWLSLGIPANQIVTGVQLASADSFVLRADSGGGTIKAVTLTPTGLSAIELAPSRVIGAAESVWSTQTGAGTSGIQVQSGGSLTITLGSILTTTAIGSPDVRVYQDNIEFTVSYEAAVSISPDAANVAIAGLAPTVTGLAAEFGNPPAGALTIDGAAPSLQIVSPVTGGGGGPGLLLALALNLEPVPLGYATLVITGYAPSIFHPITLAGSDDLISESATVAGSGVKITAAQSPVYQPPAGSLTISGLAPTVVATEDRFFAMPVTALTFTYFVPSLGIDYVIEIGVGQIRSDGFGVSTEPNYTVSPLAGSASFAGFAPVVFASNTAEPDVGSIAISGYAPELALTLVIIPPTGAIVADGYDPLAIGGATWSVSASFGSQRATATGSGFITRVGSGVLQSQPPLAFSGSGEHGHTAVGALQSGPASFHGPISATSAALQSGRATMLGRGKIKPFDHGHKRPKPPRINRFNVVLKPNKRHKFKRQRIRRPF